MIEETAMRLLIVGAEASLTEEFNGAIEGLKGVRCVVHHAPDALAGIETARVRQPHCVFVEMGASVAELRAFADEIAAAAPDAAVIAVYRPQAFSGPEQESQVIIEALRAQVVDFLRRPISSSELGALLDRLRRRAPRGHGGGEYGKVVSFISNKGGVGKSTVSTNVACELARRYPGEVLLVDLSLQLGVCASMLDIEPTQTIADAAEQLDRLDPTLLQQLALPHPSGLRVLPAPPTVLSAADVDDRVVSRVISLARRAYRYVIVDTFPVVDGVVMGVLDVSNVICVVTQVIVPVLNGTASLLETLQQLGIARERNWIVLNRAQRSFPGELTIDDVESHLDLPVRHEVAYDKRLPMAVNMGLPRVLYSSRWNRFRRSISTLVDDIDAMDVNQAPPLRDRTHDDAGDAAVESPMHVAARVAAPVEG